MSLDEETLETVANGGEMDFEKWPAMVEPLVERLEYIVFNIFSMPEYHPEPTQPSQDPSSLSNPSASFLQEPNSVPASSNKENTPPPDLQTPPRPAASSSSMAPPPPSSSLDRVPDSQPRSDAPANGTASLPAPLMLLLDSIRSTLRTLFTSKPPHTIQRLAELVVRPNAHYRTLPAYLRAVDRVVSVTSSADVFPLQQQPSGANQPNGVLNGTETSFILPEHAMSGDDSLGGALLTPIPWLNTTGSPDATAVPEGLDPMTTVQPLQMEGESQQPIVQSQPAAAETVEPQAMDTTTTQNTASSPPVDTSEDVPHARGPQIIGVEDMGLQDGHGVEMTLSTPEETASKEEGQTSGNNNESSQTAADSADKDGDIQLDDAKGAAATTATGATGSDADASTAQKE